MRLPLKYEVRSDEWRYRPTVRTDGSQPSNRGSIPRTATIQVAHVVTPAISSQKRPISIRDMRARTWTVGLLLFGSGFCALVYQIGWFREFRLIFGASTAASAAVLAIFIGGLGIGSLLLGPRADRMSRPLLFYSNLEATIAICAALSPLLVRLVRN